MCCRASHFLEFCMFSLSVRALNMLSGLDLPDPGSHHGARPWSYTCRCASQPSLDPSLGSCTGLSWFPLAALFLAGAQGQPLAAWLCHDAPGEHPTLLVLSHREPLAAAVPWHWAVCGLCFSVSFWVVSCFFYHIHSVKPFSTFP